MAKIKSLLACVIVLADVRIIPQNNEISDADFEKLKENKDYKDLVKEEKLIVLVTEDEDENLDSGDAEGANVAKMKNAELWAYAESQGIEIPAGSKRADVLKLIELLSESDD